MTRAFLALCLIACGGSKTAPKTTPAPPPATPETVVTPTPTPAATPSAKTLYERLGGEKAITAVVEEFVTKVTTDARIKERFFNTDAVALKKFLVEFVCFATGGGCKYTGKEMPEVHAGMEVVDDEFAALVEDLALALDKFNVPAKEKGELLGALGPLKPQS